LFISGLSEQHTPGELASVFHKAIRPSFPKCEIRYCNLLRITDQDLNRSQNHAMLSLQPAKAALWAVRTLDGTLVHGRRIQVRRYILRNPLRGAGNCALTRPDLNERRRSRLVVDLVKPRHTPWFSTLSHWIASSPFTRA